MEPAVHTSNGPVLQPNRRCAVRTGLFYDRTSGSLSERSGSIYSRIGGALYELDCSIVEPAVHSPNGPVLQANRLCAVRTGLFYSGTSGSLSERSGSTAE